MTNYNIAFEDGVYVFEYHDEYGFVLQMESQLRSSDIILKKQCNFILNE